jgi:uncharacterized protein (DUF1015 family)
VPRFDPFPGLRYSPRHVPSLDDVVCPPYDVIAEEERVRLAARSPLNSVHIELPQPEGAEDRYQAARQLLDAWRDGGVLARDRVPSFYGYRMTFTDPTGARRQTVGVLGALALEPPGTGILPHEQTTPKAKTDRLELLRACGANISPIWALTPSVGLAEACDPPARPAERATDDDKVMHEVWPVVDPDHCRRIQELVAQAPVLVADGHHRYEVALAYQKEVGQGGIRHGDHDAVLALIVELSDDHLSVQPIHRLLTGLPDHFDLVAALEPFFTLTPTERPDRTLATRMADGGTLAVHTRTGTWLAQPRENTTEAATHDLDSSRLEVALAALPPHTVIYQHGWDLAADAVTTRKADAAVLLRPATVTQIAEVGRGGSRMPAKTTFFWPKPRTGMVMREVV